MQQLFRSPLLWVSVAVLALAGCQNTPHRAPVEDRPVGKGAPAAIPGTAITPAPESKPLPGAENAGKPGYYTVKPGDTLIRIAMDNGQGWRDVARWNGMDNPDQAAGDLESGDPSAGWQVPGSGDDDRRRVRPGQRRRDAARARRHQGR